MRLLFATTHKMLPENAGGMEQNTHGLALALRARGHQVASLSGLAGAGWTGHMARAQLWWGRPYAQDRRLGYPSFRSYNPDSVFAAVIQYWRPDLVCIQGGHRHDQLIDTALGADIPVLSYIHSDDCVVQPDRHRQAQQNGRLRTIANSCFTASLLTDRTPAVIRPLVDPDRYRAKRHSPQFVTFINPSPHKGLDIALSIAKARPDSLFRFIRTQRYSRFDLGGLPANVRVDGPFVDMRSVYARARLIMAPSVCQETWGRIATEAHINGVPVLGSTRGGLPEAIGSGGLCVPHDAPLADWLAAFDKLAGPYADYGAWQAQARAAAARPDIQIRQIIDSFEAEMRAVSGL